MKNFMMRVLMLAAPLLVSSLGHNCGSVKELYKEDGCCADNDKQLASVNSMSEKVVVIFEIIVNNNTIANALYPSLNAGWNAGQYVNGEYTIAYTTDPDCELCVMKGTNMHFLNSLDSVKAWAAGFENLPVEAMGAFCAAFHWPEVRVIGPGVGSDDFKTYWHHILRRWRDVCPQTTHPALYWGGTTFLGTSQPQTVLPPNMF